MDLPMLARAVNMTTKDFTEDGSRSVMSELVSDVGRREVGYLAVARARRRDRRLRVRRRGKRRRAGTRRRGALGIGSRRGALYVQEHLRHLLLEDSNLVAEFGDGARRRPRHGDGGRGAIVEVVWFV